MKAIFATGSQEFFQYQIICIMIAYSKKIPDKIFLIKKLELEVFKKIFYTLRNLS
jgi:hypothetical protein